MIHSPFDTPIEMAALEAQKVVNGPFALRYRMAYDAHLASDVLNVFIRALFSQLA